MSANATRRHTGGRVLRTAFSLALIGVAGGAVFKGVQFARLGALEWAMEGTPPAAGDAAPSDVPAERAQERRDALAQWSDSWGLRDKARLLYFSVGQRELVPPSPEGLRELAAALQVDPVRSTSWMDLAEMTWPTLALRPVSMAAWEMSRLTGPYEYDDMLRRVQFLARRWAFADQGSKQQFAYDVSVLRRFPDPFAAPWDRLLRSVPAAQRTLIQEEIGATPMR
ncbi:hypothetical protein [Ancylobacter sp.]|uniref:hypothetical protein n=1 Tax=Ancylobacter sp. TaxID=1872567 RepID=UPI003D0E0FAB